MSHKEMTEETNTNAQAKCQVNKEMTEKTQMPKQNAK
jgi:hypothetical protein